MRRKFILSLSVPIMIMIAIMGLCRTIMTGATLAVLALMPSSARAFCFEEAGFMYGINPSLLQAIANVESNFNASAVHTNKNGTVDLGLMQINSAWLDVLKLDKERLMQDACYNVKTGASILKNCMDRWGYTWRAVGCYNASSDFKRSRYSRKIYSALIKEKGRSKLQAPIAEKPSADESRSLYFRIREDESHEPDNRSAGKN